MIGIDKSAGADVAPVIRLGISASVGLFRVRRLLISASVSLLGIRRLRISGARSLLLGAEPIAKETPAAAARTPRPRGAPAR